MSGSMAQFIYEYAGITLQIAGGILFGVVIIGAFLMVLIHSFNVYRLQRSL